VHNYQVGFLTGHEFYEPLREDAEDVLRDGILARWPVLLGVQVGRCDGSAVDVAERPAERSVRAE
jgi:hypothetical protein